MFKWVRSLFRSSVPCPPDFPKATATLDWGIGEHQGLKVAIHISRCYNRNPSTVFSTFLTQKELDDFLENLIEVKRSWGYCDSAIARNLLTQSDLRGVFDEQTTSPANECR